MRVVLVPEFPSAPLPDKGAAMAINDRYRVEETKLMSTLPSGSTSQYWRASIHAAGRGDRSCRSLHPGAHSHAIPNDVMLRRDLPE